MMTSRFLEIAGSHLTPLFQEYGFRVTGDTGAVGALGDAEVVLESPSVFMSLVLDRGQVLVEIGEIAASEAERLELTDVLRAYAPEVGPPYVLAEDDSPREAAVEGQVQRVVQLLREYCDPLLKGDFSRKLEIKKLEEVRVATLLEALSTRHEEFLKRTRRA